MIINIISPYLILLKTVVSDAYSIPAYETYEQKNVVDYGEDLDMLSSIALSHDKVLSVRAFEIDGTRVFAILTSPIYLKSERDALKNELFSLLSQGKTTYISFDNDVYRAIKDDMTEEQKNDLIERIESREK
ncbi:MAG: hypothetical protein IJ226_02495 [Clostridia bacterium]|nr:hypothetical protein [Clostridia bacterium]